MKDSKYYIHLIVLFLLPLLSSGQPDHVDRLILYPPADPATKADIPIDSPNPGAEDTLFRDYIPYDYHNTIPVNVNLVFIQKDNGTGNFQEDNEEHQRLWDDITREVNLHYSNIRNSELDSCFAWHDPFIADARIRFKFNRLYIKRSALWDWSAYGSTPYGINGKLDE